MANLSIIILSHNKPAFVKEALQSVLDQTHQNWEAILIDSGVLLKQGFFDYITDKRIRVIASGESAEQAKKTNMASWCFNRLIRAGELHGELVMYLCDDDILYPQAFETFWGFYTAHNREPQAMYASQDIGLVDSQGATQIIGKRIADRPAGRFCKGRKLDCEVDYLQFCHSRAILEKMRVAYRTDEYHPEDLRRRAYADGVFMEKIGSLTKIHNI
ncbi:MAG: cgeD, partial [Pedosphaera sp.]|nr:cgeD [Pedosphaera sp.]